MFTCPNCGSTLTRKEGRTGLFWSCDGFGGRAVGVALLRRLIGNEGVNAIWSRAISTANDGGRACPICSRGMTEESISTSLTVSLVTNGAVLNLGFNVTNQVAALLLVGTNQPNGVYNSGNSGGYIAGTGALLVAQVGPGGPATITNSISGSTLTLTWPAGRNWRLVSQTNSLSTGLIPNSAAWTTVSGASDGSANITINPGNPAVYYKLVYP